MQPFEPFSRREVVIVDIIKYRWGVRVQQPRLGLDVFVVDIRLPAIIVTIVPKEKHGGDCTLGKILGEGVLVRERTHRESDFGINTIVLHEGRNRWVRRELTLYDVLGYA